MKLYSVFLLILGLSVVFTGCGSKEEVDLTLGVGDFVGELPTFVAYENGYFEDEGLNVTMTYYTAGKDALQGMLNGEVVIASCSQTPVMYEAFKRDDFVFIGSLMTSGSLTNMIGRSDRGVHKPKDLEGKRVGMYLGTAAEYLWTKYASYHDLDISDIEVVDLTPEELTEALIGGEVDAIVVWEPHIYNAIRVLGDESTFLDVEKINSGTWLAIANRAYVKEQPEIIERYLRAINRAEDFINENSDEAQRIFINYSESTMDYTEYIFKYIAFDLTMSEAILEVLESQASWALAEGKVEGETIPNYLDFFYEEGLNTVTPVTNTVIK